MSTPAQPAEELPKQYDHTAAQAKWYQFWESHGYFNSDPPSASGATAGLSSSVSDSGAMPTARRGHAADKKPFTIVIPPPNVTGALHLGHALNDTLQDIIIRFRRMQGFNTLWMPGTDHAGIATQAVVERRLKEEESLDRHKLGREGLVKRIWEWKDKYETRILEQFRQMGFSCDWRRTRFTLDEMCARAVRHTFFRMFKDGLIFRGKRLVNWDTFLQTAVADDEVYHETVKGHFWHIRYPIISADKSKGEPEFVTIATTRPETMLGDTAVAVHPDPAAALDKVERELRERLATATAKERPDIQKQLDDLANRRQAILPRLIQLRDMAQAGRKLKLPLANREIPLIVDQWAKPELGSGCVKITPAHDENDYQVWQRHKEIGAINIMSPEGMLNDAVPEKYRGLKMHTKAREAVIADLVALGLHNPETDREDREIDLAHSDRSKTPIEPYLADQWFVKMSDTDGKPGLAQKCMDAVLPSPLVGEGPGVRGSDEKIQITPARYTKSYLDWLGEKRDWCIGRQLWWGHQIPVWQISRKAKAFTPGMRLDEPNEEADRAFEDALAKYISDFGLQEDIAYSKSEISKTYYVCAKSERAIDELTCLQRRRHRAHQTTPYSIDPPYEPDLPMDDPRLESDKHLRNLTYEMKEQDPDVLDTWFSSALWPMSTLGWPGPALSDKPKGPANPEWSEQKYYYPTSVLITSREIITLWVARMVLMGLYNLGEIPFHDVYIHPKILDGFGETMSKSKGNGVDPLDIIAKFGTDALRFGLAYMATETQDVRMPVEFECPHCQKLIEQTQKNRTQPRLECPHCKKPFSTQWAAKPEDIALPRAAVVSERFELARNFCNKLWNAARFALLNLEGYAAGGVEESKSRKVEKLADGADSSTLGPSDFSTLALEDRWILSRLTTVTLHVTDALEHFKFADAARVLYDFAWDEFCSFYLEMSKSRLQDETTRATAQRILAHTLDVILRLLHPMSPFICEDVWQRLNAAAPTRGLSTLGGWGRPTGAPSDASGATAGSSSSAAAESIMIAPWPEADRSRINEEIERRFALFQEVLRGLREVRARQDQLSPKTVIEFSCRCDEESLALLKPMQPFFESMASAKPTNIGPQVTAPPISAHFTASGIDVYVDLAGHIDVAAEIARKEKEAAKVDQLIAAKEKQLSNEAFVSRAPPAVIAKERAALDELRATKASTESTLATLQLAKK